jgi:hypothetical protein
MLYPLQNGTLNVVRDSGVPFYLTGGTALSRGYFGHRYSDDLDFFINDDENFHEDEATFLKIDFVNDIVPHYGDFVETEIFPRLDNVRNILSNKLGAVFRFYNANVSF